MKKFLLGFLGGIVFAGLVLALLFFGFLAAVSVADNRPTVTDNSVLVLDLEGSVPERSGVDIPLPILGQQTGPTILDTYQLLKKGAMDPRIKALMIAPKGLSVGWAKLEELRAQIIEFKKSGKPRLRLPPRRPELPNTTSPPPPTKSTCRPTTGLNVKGLRAELTFLKNTLDKVGVAMEFEGIGMYKDAPDTYTKRRPRRRLSKSPIASSTSITATSSASSRKAASCSPTPRVPRSTTDFRRPNRDRQSHDR
ncbi:MAG: hypothetical protein WDO18_18595 [Acidobacteriota bacterium]